MNAEQYLSTTEIWFTRSPEIQALDNKQLILIDGESEIDARLYVSNADPNGPNAGKIAVKLLNFAIVGVEWTNAESGPPPTTVLSHPWQRFLTQDALNLLRPDEDGMLSLTLPTLL